MILLWNTWQTYWNLYHKVTFDGINKLIIVNDEVTDVDVEQDLYSDWKEWIKIYDHTKFAAAMRTVGGDTTVAPDQLGASFFLINGWRIYIDHAVNFDGNLYSDDYAYPDYFVTAAGLSIAQTKVSNLIDKVAPSPAQLSAYSSSVWSGTSPYGISYASTLSLAATSGGLTSGQATMLLEMYKILGLDPADPLVDQLDRRYVYGSSIVQVRTGDPDVKITTTRQ